MKCDREISVLANLNLNLCEAKPNLTSIFIKMNQCVCAPCIHWLGGTMTILDIQVIKKEKNQCSYTYEVMVFQSIINSWATIQIHPNYTLFLMSTDWI
jgi:uncharacterized membrane protein